MPLQATSGAASYDAFGGGVAAVPNYIEEVFSTYLYTGTGSAQTITNGIDLSTKGGLIFTKCRSTGGTFYVPAWVSNDTGLGSFLHSSSTAALAGVTNYGFNSNGFTINTTNSRWNESGQTYASWTFRKQPKFFDVVTYTGDGTAGKTVSHNLGSVPGCIIVKRTDSTANWAVQHRSLTADGLLFLNSTAANNSGASGWNSTEPTSTQFTVGTNAATNASGATYVAYLFAHDAGGFGLTGTDNVITCGSFTGQATVDLGWEPQFILYKVTNVTGDWKMVDNMRGLVVDNGSGTGDKVLKPNLTNAEAGDYVIDPTSTGFKGYESVGNTYIYIAIRRGPMKVPTSGASVYMPVTANNAQGTQNTTGFPVDLQVQSWRGGVSDRYVVDRLRGVSTTATNTEKYLTTNTSNVETSGTAVTQYWNNTGFQTSLGNAGASEIYWNFRRAPGFFDEVCYTGTGANRTLSHNLQAVPELIICKTRSGVDNWAVYSASEGATKFLILNLNFQAITESTVWNNTSPTSTQFTVGTNTNSNGSGSTYVAYLFATCAGVSKVGSYTGTGASGNAITTGFSPRFLMIKCTSTTGNWIVFDTARGMGAGSDPYLLLNTTGAETTGTDWLDVSSSGFSLNTTGNATNGSGQTYIYLAIA